MEPIRKIVNQNMLHAVMPIVIHRSARLNGRSGAGAVLVASWRVLKRSSANLANAVSPSKVAVQIDQAERRRARRKRPTAPARSEVHPRPESNRRCGKQF